MRIIERKGMHQDTALVERAKAECQELVRIFIKSAFFVFTNPDPDQLALNVVALGQSVQRLAGEIFLRDLPLKLDAVSAISCHGLLSENPADWVNPEILNCPPSGAHSKAGVPFARKTRVPIQW